MLKCDANLTHIFISDVGRKMADDNDSCTADAPVRVYLLLMHISVIPMRCRGCILFCSVAYFSSPHLPATPTLQFPVVALHPQLQDFDEKVVNKMALLVDKYGQGECLGLLDNLGSRMRTKQVSWD